MEDKGIKYLGSNTEEGKLYHQSFYTDDDYQRKDSSYRAGKIIDNYEFANKTVVDIGCNIGYFSFAAANQNAKMVWGIDHDIDAIKFAKEQQDKFEVKNTKFINEKATLETLDAIGEVDCIFALAVLSWIRKTTSREYMEKVLKKISSNSRVAFIEMQYKGEPGESEWINNDAQCKEYLQTFFKYVYKVCTTTSWGYRTVWKCLNDYGNFTNIYENDRTIGYISDNLIFKKIRKKDFAGFKREIQYLSLLDTHDIVPKVIESNETELYLAGLNAVPLDTALYKYSANVDFTGLRNALMQICNTLEQNNIRHQDINLENILVSKSKMIYIIDFEYATSSSSSEIINPYKSKLYEVDNFIMAAETLKRGMEI